MEFKQANIGVWVKIKKHFNDDMCWTREQEKYDGEESIILRTYIDSVCRLSIDRLSFLWSYNSLLLISQDISEIKKGSIVILGSHDWLFSNSTGYCHRSWNPRMEKYVGKEAVVSSITGGGFLGELVARVNIDNGEFQWRLCNMTLKGQTK